MSLFQAGCPLARAHKFHIQSTGRMQKTKRCDWEEVIVGPLLANLEILVLDVNRTIFA